MLGAVAVLLAVSVVACSTDGTSESSPTSTTTRRSPPTTTSPRSTTAVVPPAEALDRGVANLAASFDRIDAASLMLVDYLARRYQLPELGGARAAAETRLATGAGLTEDERVLARLVDPSAPAVAPTSSDLSPTTVALALALQCDVEPLPDDYVTRLDDLVNDGGYSATHALLAIGWARELGCEFDDIDRIESVASTQVATDLAAGTSVDDRRLEQSAFLAYLNQIDRVPAGWSAEVVVAQRPDGGWGQDDPQDETSWHATLLAVWTLAAQTGRGESDVPMILASTR